MPSIPAMLSQRTVPSLHDYMSYPSPISVPRRSRIQRACIACRKRKIKCNGNLAGCAHCSEKNQQCHYEAVPDDEKLKARSYKRQLIQRRQQTRVYWDRRQLSDPVMFAAAYGLKLVHAKEIAPCAFGHLGLQPVIYPSDDCMQQLATPFPSPSTSSQLDLDFQPYFPSSIASPDSSAQLQSITGMAAFWHPTPAPAVLKPPHATPVLSSSLPSPTLSSYSTSSSLLTPTSETFAELNTPLSATFPPMQQHGSCASAQVHSHDFAGGLEIYNVPCIASAATGNATKGFVMMDMPAPAADAPDFSSPTHLPLPLPASFNFASTLESAM